MTARRPTALLITALAALSACGGGESQDANEAEGTFRVDVTDASFPSDQSIAGQEMMRIRVRNPGEEALPNVAVTVETKGKRPGDGPVAFAQSSGDSRLADRNRPVWVLETGPRGGTSAYSNTWSLGRLPAGRSRTFEWKLTPVEPGTYSIAYRVAPGADAVDLLDRHDEHLAVADLARAGVLEDGVDHRRHVARGDHALELDLGAQPVGQRRAAVALGDPLLAARALDLGDREGREAELQQVVADRLERLVSDERLHLLHEAERSDLRRGVSQPAPGDAERTRRARQRGRRGARIR